MFLLETKASAAAAGRSAIAELAGYAQTFDPHQGQLGCNPSGDAARSAVMQALAMAGLTPADISFIASSANGNPATDAMEAAIIADLFPRTPVAAYSAKLGETYGARASLAMAAAILDAQRGRISGTGSPCTPLAGIDLVTTTRAITAEHILVTSFSCDGNCAALVLRMAS